ncbi:homeobox protein OTX-like [Microtus oregoni]|uniref:homeobox protein OTX-like n=1 Tax=Microtus oregoni TaxID=111838 RepID=UPI001BB17547|nr:homeobox protein OTX-like [Microtus oregoni]
MGDYSVLPSNEHSSSPVNPDFQGSSSISCPQGLLPSQGPPRSQASVSDLRKQLRKRTVFSQEQKLVLQEYFDKCMNPSQEQCMALAQRFGLKESHIRMWFKNRRARARQNLKNSQELPGEPGSGSHDRPAYPQGSVPLVASANADYLCQSPELQNHPSTVSEPSLQMSQSPLILPGVLMQSSLQGHSDDERIPRPHVSPDPSTKPSPQLLGTGTALSRHQIPLISSVSSGCKVSQVPIASSDKCGDQQVHPEVPRKQRRERTVYTEEQKVLLQRHFDQDKDPSLQKRMELALMIGVTEYAIKIWFKNQRAKNKKASGGNS